MGAVTEQTPDAPHPSPAPPSATGGPAPAAPPVGPLTVRPITEAEHVEVLRRHPGASFLQNPRWARVKTDWSGQSLGFEADGRLVGAALVLGRRLPVPGRTPLLGRSFLAYVAEGPVLDAGVDVVEALAALVAELHAQGAFLVRVAPPGVVRRWDADTVRKALPDPAHRMLTDLEPAEEHADALELERRLREAGWRAPEVLPGFSAGQPMFQARIPLEGLDEEGVLARMSGSSRKRTRRSLRNDLDVVVGGPERLDEWEALQDETAERDGFTGRRKEYFARLMDELGGSELADVTYYLAEYQGDPVAAAFHFRQGHVCWRPYSASSQKERKRDAPRLLEFEQIRQGIADGCHWLDLGGVPGSVDSEDRITGLTEFKTTQGADIVQTHGEWDFPLHKTLAHAFGLYMSRR